MNRLRKFDEFLEVRFHRYRRLSDWLWEFKWRDHYCFFCNHHIEGRYLRWAWHLAWCRRTRR